MSWAVGRTNPLIRYPYAPLTNGGFETGDLTAWDNRGGAFSVQSSIVKVGTYALKLNPAAGTAYVVHNQLVSAWKSVTLYPLYMYAWVRADSVNAGSEVMRFVIVHYSNAYGFKDFSSNSTITFGNGTSTQYNCYIPVDSKWHLARIGPWNTSQAVASDDRMSAYIGWDAGLNTATVYVDDVFIGPALDFQDIGTIPDGARAVHPYEIPKVVASVSTVAPNGNYASTLLASGLSRGKIVTSPISNAGKVIVSQFNDYCADGTPFSLYMNQSDLTRDYYSKCALYGNGRFNDGFKQLAGRKDWIWTRDWRQVP